VLVLAAALDQTAPRAGGPVTQRPSGPSSSATVRDASADAYYQFLAGRFLESRGDVEGAVKAYQEAMRLDPRSSEIPAELASLYARQNRVREAIQAAELSLDRDATNSDAHRVLGMIYTALAEGGREVSSGAPAPRNAAMVGQALDHLEKVKPMASGDLDVNVQLALGRLYLRTEAYDKAIAALTNVLEQEPGYPQGIALLVQAYTEAGRSAEALTLLKEAVDLEPAFYPALAEALERTQQWAEAASAYEQASSHDPANVDLVVKRANALMSIEGGREVPRARDLLIDIVQKNPTNGWALYLLARAQRETGQLDAAEASARRLMTLSPRSSWGPHALAQVFEQRREYSKVIDALTPLIPVEATGRTAARDADTALLLTHVGFAYSELGKHDQAVKAFERAATLSPNDPTLEAHLLEAHIGARQFSAAVARGAAARARHPEDLRIAALSAQALEKTGAFDQGLAIVKETVEAQASNPAAYVALADFYDGAQRPGEAIDVLKDASRRFPGDTSLLFQLGSVFDHQKRFSEAEQAFRDVLDRDPRHAPALNYIGYILAERGERLDESVTYIQRALELDPHNGAYRDSLGWAYFKMNRLDLAEPNLKQAAEQMTNDSVIQDHYADLLFRRGRFKEAIAVWERALAGDGESIERAAIARKIRQAQERARQK
jgi:tetratricopeptide (TPR) repeat protein